MKNTYKLLLLIFIIICSTQSWASNKDSLSFIEVAKALSYEEKGDAEKAAETFLKAIELSANHIVKRKYFSFLIRNEKFEEASELLDKPENKFDFLLNAEYYAKAGAIMLHGGPRLGDKSWKNLLVADSIMQYKVEVKDYWLWSQIKLGLCYTHAISRTRFTDSGRNEEFSILRRHNLYTMLESARLAVKYDKENLLAQTVVDSLESKFKELGLELPILKNPEEVINPMSKDSVDTKDSLDNIKIIKSRLPQNMNQIKTHLDEYDEIVFALDYSGSMSSIIFGNQIGSPSRIEALKEICKYLIKNIRKSISLGLKSIEGACETDPFLESSIGKNRLDLLEKIKNLSAFGGTPLNGRMENINELFSAEDNSKIVFLVTDGVPSCRNVFDICAIANRLKAKGIDIAVLSLLENKSDFSNTYQYSIYNCITEVGENILYELSENGSLSQSDNDSKQKALISFRFPYLEVTQGHSPKEHVRIDLHQVVAEKIEESWLDSMGSKNEIKNRR